MNGNHKDNDQELEQAIMTFQVITDTHVTADPQHVHNRNLDRALKDIIAVSKDSIGIMHVGDVTDHGFEREFTELHRILSENEDGLPKLLYAVGNHDVGLGVWEKRISKFLTETGMSAPYHTHWIKGYHFIFLGTEKGLQNFCDLSEEQLKWLDGKLSEQASLDKPIFLFLHQPLMDTVAGSYVEQDWYGVTQDEPLRAILAKYPQAILFTGHTHWELEAEHTMADGQETMPAMFNASSVAYLWTDDDEHKAGSQGYYVEVYADKVLVKGRDFITRRWIQEAQFQVEYKQ
ncbi:metallophosphoesterase [Cohnella sp.]|uniref:metallophosphoesterase family protein n=1 Tax=Cohnella sp. TaxID=1883426 RepID=UPI003563F7F2